jgi:indole-3-glycerol phosphate synthase
MDVSLVLVGEALMRAQDPRQAIRELLGPQVPKIA